MTMVTTGTARSVWTPARIFLALSAVYHLLLGIAGLVVDQTFPIGSEATKAAESGLVFGLFETNGWHSLASVLLGVFSLYYSISPRFAREAAFALGASQLLVFVGFIAWPPSTFSFASNAADQVVHATTAVASLGAALLTRAEVTPNARADR